MLQTSRTCLPGSIRPQRSFSARATPTSPRLTTETLRTMFSLTLRASLRASKDAVWAIWRRPVKASMAGRSSVRLRIAACSRLAEITFRCAKSQPAGVARQGVGTTANDKTTWNAGVRDTETCFQFSAQAILELPTCQKPLTCSSGGQMRQFPTRTVANQVVFDEVAQ